MAISPSRFQFCSIVADGFGSKHPSFQRQHFSASTINLPNTQIIKKSPFFLGTSFRTQLLLDKMTVSSSSSSSMSSLITELEKKQQVDSDRDVIEEVEERYGNDQSESSLPLSQRWREIAGESNWTGLLDPIDPLLRSELIRYGEMAQACYDAFDSDPFSMYCGSCKHIRRRFFESLGLPGFGYDVTRYLYATSNIRLPNFLKTSRWPTKWSELANWIGYVAVSNDEVSARLGRRDIAVAWRGTVTKLEWLADLTDFLKPVNTEGIPTPDPTVKVESGFVDLYTDKHPDCRFCKYSAREQVLTEVRKLVELYTSKGETVSISVTGHSLGSALAMLSAYDLAETGVNRGIDGVPVQTTVYSFSGPRVGNFRFKDRFENVLGIKALRILNVHDTVPKVPGVIFNEHFPPFLRHIAERIIPWWVYTHVGVELNLDHKKSPFLKDTMDLSCFHNLEAHLHLLAGYGGRNEAFVLLVGRDPALVNKACDFLEDHHLVPPHWRQDENRGMIMRDGRWMQPERPRFDDHPDDTHHHLFKLGFLKQQDN